MEPENVDPNQQFVGSILVFDGFGRLVELSVQDGPLLVINAGMGPL